MHPLNKTRPVAILLPLARAIAGRLQIAWRMLSLYRERRALATLDDRLLKDIGISPAQAENEARRPIWDAPQHWQTGWD